jgi:hypothetical protein
MLCSLKVSVQQALMAQWCQMPYNKRHISLIVNQDVKKRE